MKSVNLLLPILMLTFMGMSDAQESYVDLRDLCECYNIVDACSGNQLDLAGSVTITCGTDFAFRARREIEEGTVCFGRNPFRGRCESTFGRVCLDSKNWEVCGVEGCDILVSQTLSFEPTINGMLIGSGANNAAQTGGVVPCIGPFYTGDINRPWWSIPLWDICSAGEVLLRHPDLEIPENSGLCLNVSLYQFGVELSSMTFDHSSVIDGTTNIAPLFQVPINGQFLELRMSLTCCGTNTNCTINWQQRGYIRIEDTPPSVVDVDFDFGVSNQVENLLGDPVVDGLIPRATSRPGPEIGPAASRFASARAAGDLSDIESFTYQIWEVNCSGSSETPVLIATYEATPIAGAQPENIDFTSILVSDGVDEGYFADNRDKCYKVTLTANNSCGSTTAEGYFSITDQCTFCREAGQDEAYATVTPTLVSDVLNLQVMNSSKRNSMRIYDAAGQLVASYDNSASSIGRYDVSGLSAGMYIYQVDIDHQIISHGKFIKQ